MKGLLRWKVYFSFNFQALAPRGLVFAPTTKNEQISGAFALDKSNFLSCGSPCCVDLDVRFFQRKMWESQPKQPLMCRQKMLSVWRFSQSCLARSGINTLPVQQQVLGSIPRENYSRGLRKQRFPARPFAVLDAIWAKCHEYKPGTRRCYKCCTRVDEETRFTSHPDYKPPVFIRTTNRPVKVAQ